MARSWDKNRWSLEEAGVLAEIADLRAAADQAARHVHGLYVTFLLFVFYVAVIVFSTTDEQLLKETGARLPLLNVDLPLLGFYIFIPWLVLFFHTHLLNQFFLLSRKLFNLDKKLRSLPPELQSIQREMPFPLTFSYVIVGTHYPRPVRWPFRMVVIVIILLAPIALLLAIQYKFLPYHSEGGTFNHQLVFTLDLLVLWIFWPRLFSHSERWRIWWPWSWHLSERWRIWWPWLWHLLGKTVYIIRPRYWPQRLYMWGVLASTFLLLIGIWTLLVPHVGGIEKRLAEHEQGWSCIHRNAEREQGLFCIHRNLELRDQTLMRKKPPIELLSAAREKGPEAEAEIWLNDGEALDLHGRDLRHADFFASKLWNADLRGAQLQGANLGLTQLQGAKLQEAQLEDANLQQTQLQSANLRQAWLKDAKLQGAQLQHADLQEAQLQNANLGEMKLKDKSIRTELQDANLQGAQLQGVELRWAQLQGADLRWAKLQGADLWRAQLQGADLHGAILLGTNLQEAQLSGANLQEARLQGANLRWAKLQGTDLQKVQLQGADLQEAQLQGAKFSAAQLQGAKFSAAQLQGADLQLAQLQGTDFQKAQLQGADLRYALVYGTKFQEVELSRTDLRVLRWPLDERKELLSMFSEIKELEARLEKEGKHWSRDGLKRVTQAIDRLRSIFSGSPLKPAAFSPRQKESYVMHDRGGLFKDWPAPPDKAEFEQKRADYRAGLACSDQHIAEGMWRQATKWGEEAVEGDSVLEQALRDKAESGDCPALAKALAELTCTNRHIAKNRWRQAEDDSALAEMLRAKAESGDCPVLAEVLKENQ